MNPSRFDILAYTGGKLRVEGFDLPVVVDLAGLTAEGAIPITIKHDTGDATILGQTDPDAILNDGKSLLLGGQITADPELSPSVKRVIAMAGNGHKWQASIGAQIEESTDVAAGQTISVNGQDLAGPFTLATRSVLRETAVLGMGADRKTSVVLSAEAILTLKAEPMAKEEAATEDPTTPDDFETYCTTEDAKAALQNGYAAYLRNSAAALETATVDEAATDESVTEPDPMAAAPADPTEPDPTKKKEPPMSADAKLDVKAQVDLNIKAARKAAADEISRQAEIKAKCAGDDVLIAKAIGEGWDMVRAELEFVKRQRSQAPAGHSHSGTPGDMLQAIQCGMLMRAGVDLGHRSFGTQTALALGLPAWLRAGINAENKQKALEAGWKFRDYSMVDLCKAAAGIDGGRSEFLDGSNKGFVRAAVSGGSLTEIFTTNMNALMLQKLDEAPDSTQGWTRETDAANFQLMERIRLVKGGNLTKHTRGGTADHATRDSQAESYRIARYSQQFAIDEQDIIDDHFQALKDMPDEMALACGRLRPDLVYYVLMSNPTLTASGAALFSASQPAGITGGSAQSNLATGAALAADKLQAAMAAMFNFRENGVGLNLHPTHILVPMVLWGTAANLLYGQTIVATGSTDLTLGDASAIAEIQKKFGRIEIVSDQRLTNGVVDPNTGSAASGSSTTWRLVSNRVPTIEVAYLRGSGRAPQVRPYALDKGQWGIGWDVNLDIGAAALEWRGMYEARA